MHLSIPAKNISHLFSKRNIHLVNILNIFSYFLSGNKVRGWTTLLQFLRVLFLLPVAEVFTPLGVVIFSLVLLPVCLSARGVYLRVAVLSRGCVSGFGCCQRAC